MQPFENLSGLDRKGAVAAAERLLADPKTAIFFAGEKNEDVSHWLLDDPSRRSINYHDHSWDMIEPVLLALEETGDRDWLDLACNLALDWSRHFATSAERAAPVGERHMAWYDMAVGLRAYRLAYVIEAVETRGLLSDEEHDRLWQSLLLHADYLADDDNVMFHNNHGFFQAAGQLAMGRRFADRSDAMRAAKAQGEARFRRMLEAQFSSEGIHLEHSPDYHRMVHRTARAVVDAGLVEDRDTVEFVERVERGLSWFVTPDGRIANIGDSERTSIRATPDEARQRWATDAMRYVSTGGALGSRDEGRVRAFREGGYMAARIPQDGSNDLAGESYLLQQAAFHSRTHKHADSLSFIWHDRGRPLLVDAGRYGYGAKTAANSPLREQGFWYSDPNRIYCETTRAHNCLEFDGEDYPRRGMSPPGSLVGRLTEMPEDDIVAFETEARHFGGMRHARLLVLKAGAWLVCLDWFKDGHGRPHDVVQWFHLHPDIRLASGEQLGFVEQGEKTDALHVMPLLTGVDGVEHARGQMEPRMQGWWSPSGRKIEANDAIGFRVEQRESATMATLFTLGGQASPLPEACDVNVSGRKGVLSWREGDRTHTLRFERPEGGDMTIDHETT